MHSETSDNDITEKSPYKEHHKSTVVYSKPTERMTPLLNIMLSSEYIDYLLHSTVILSCLPPPGPYGSPQTLMATVSGTTTANISWSPPDPSQLNGIITYYTVVLRDLMFGLPDRVYNTTATSFSFTGLDEYGRYASQVAAATIGGLGPLSSATMFTTLEASKSRNHLPRHI